jgi:ribosomal protein S18 acetylase RimI-like enzyme
MTYIYKFYNNIEKIPNNLYLELENNVMSIDNYLNSLLVNYFNTVNYNIMFIIEKISGNVVGVLGISYIPSSFKKKMNLDFKEKTYNVGNIFIFPKYRGKGICKLMLNKLINYVRTKKLATRLKLDVYETNISAIKCYVSIGFTKHNNQIADNWLNKNKKQLYGFELNNKMNIYTLKL